MPTSMDPGVIAEILKTGLVGALLIASVFFNFRLYYSLQDSHGKRLQDNKDYAKANEEGTDKRLSEYSRIATALEKNSATSLTLISTSEARTQAFSELANAFAVLVEQLRAYQSNGKDNGDRAERRQEDIIKRLDEIVTSLRLLSTGR